MANTFVKIASVTVDTPSSTIDFTSIPQTYTDLKLVFSLRSSRATYGDDDMYININGLTTNQTQRFIQGSGSGTPGSFTSSRWGVLVPASAATANVFGNGEVYISNYTSSNYKSSALDAITENNGATAYMRMTAALWSSASAITQLTLVCAAGNFVQYSTATLYGITKL